MFSGYAQGGTWAVKANLKGVDVHEREIQHAIDSILLQIDNSLSGYNKGSLLSVFNSGREKLFKASFMPSSVPKRAVIL